MLDQSREAERARSGVDRSEVGVGAGVWEGEEFVPANFLLATARLDGAAVVVGGEDFGIRGGSPNLPGLRKSRSPGDAG